MSDTDTSLNPASAAANEVFGESIVGGKLSVGPNPVGQDFSDIASSFGGMASGSNRVGYAAAGAGAAFSATPGGAPVGGALGAGAALMSLGGDLANRTNRPSKPTRGKNFEYRAATKFCSNSKFKESSRPRTGCRGHWGSTSV